MTYGTSHLLIGGGCFHGEGQEKISLCKGGHYMKNKNIGGGGVLSTQPDQQKGPNTKMLKKCKKLSNIGKKFPRSFRSLGILQTSYF